MYDLTKLNKTGVIICPNSTKEQILQIINDDFSYNYKFITKEELFNNVYFSYDKKAILYLMKKNYSYESSLEILQNLNFIKGGNNKLDELSSLKEELLNNNLLKTNKNFLLLLKKQIYVINYSKNDLELKNTLSSLNLNYQYLEEEKTEEKEIIVKSYNKIEEEVNDAFKEICALNLKGVSLKNIHFFTIPDVYLNTVKKYASFYKLPVNFPSEITLYHTPLFQKYLVLAKEKGLKEGLNMIDNRVDDLGIKNEIITILNEIISLEEDDNLKLNLLISASKKKKIKTSIYQEGISIVNHEFRGDDDIFVLGFSLGSYPIIHKDTSLLTDEEKKMCSMNTSRELNLIEEENLISFIRKNSHIHISKIKNEGKDLGTTFFDSLLIDKLKMTRVDASINNSLYSETIGKIITAKAYDLKRNYNINSSYLDAYSKEDISYLSYDHSFKFSNKFINDNNIKVSYTSINEYNSCPFKYFVNRILLKNNSFEETFEMKVGNLFHKILEDSLTKEISLDDYKVEIKNNFITPSEIHFINKILPRINDVINKNKNFTLTSRYKKSLGEVSYNYKINDNTLLTGKIDKSIFNEMDKEVIIIDYKSSTSLNFNKKLVPIGLSLQLPTYAIFIEDNYKDYLVTGLYIQNILTDNEDIDKSYLLKGITLKDEEIISHIDKNLDGKSKYVSSLELTKKGTISRFDSAAYITQEELDEIILLSKEKIAESSSLIHQGKFDISPLYVNKSDEHSCAKCNFKAICFKKDEDIRYVSLNKEEE